jgi:hypothetical protein
MKIIPQKWRARCYSQLSASRAEARLNTIDSKALDANDTATEALTNRTGATILLNHTATTTSAESNGAGHGNRLPKKGATRATAKSAASVPNETECWKRQPQKRRQVGSCNAGAFYGRGFKRIWKRIRQIKVTIFFTLVIGLFACTAVHAQSAPEEFWARYKEFLENNDYASGWKLLESQSSNNSDANIYLSKGQQLLLGLGTTQDYCKATLAFEEAKRLGAYYAIAYLNYIYHGAWLQIAAEEGNPDALYELAESKWRALPTGNLMSSFSKARALQDVYRLYKRADLAGSPRALVMLTIVKGQLLEERAQIPQVDADFKRVICEIRGVTRPLNAPTSVPK